MRRMRLQWRGVTIRTALILGFGTMAALWLAEGLQAMNRMASGQQEAAAVNERYTAAQDLLSSVRTEVLLGSLFVRDALLDPDPARTQVYTAQLQTAYASAEASLSRYVPVLDSAAERLRVAELSDEIEHFRLTSVEVLASDRDLAPQEVQSLLNRFIAPRRSAVMRVSDAILSLNRRAYVQQQNVLATLAADTQRTIWGRLALALLASLCIGLVATAYVARLERDLRRRRAVEAQATQELQRLSERLVTAQEEERRTIARELHDEVGQALMAVKMELSAARRALLAGDSPYRLLDEAQSIADAAISTVRDLSHLLHPAVLDDLGLVAAVECYLKGIGARHEIAVLFEQEHMAERPASEVEVAAFRIVQEALTNVGRHAHASHCRLRMARGDGLLRIELEDDGVGFPVIRPERSAEPGLGLIGMRERATALGGSIRVQSEPGRGTRLIVELPWRDRPATVDVEGRAEPDLAPLVETHG
jgi:signal transduction histidine kinase